MHCADADPQPTQAWGICPGGTHTHIYITYIFKLNKTQLACSSMWQKPYTIT